MHPPRRPQAVPAIRCQGKLRDGRALQRMSPLIKRAALPLSLHPTTPSQHSKFNHWLNCSRF